MDPDKAYVRRVFFYTLALILALAVLAAAARAPTWARGITLGGAASLANLLLTAGAVRSQVRGRPGKGVRIGAAAGYFARMGITAAALVFSAVDDRISFWAVIPGLFTAQAVLAAGTLSERREEKG